MIRRCGIVVSLALISLLAAQALAVESGLAGVRIGESAMQLLTDPAFGPPAYMGPVGLSISREPPSPMAPFGAVATPRPVAYGYGPAGPAGASFGALGTTATAAGGMGLGPAAPLPPEPVMLWLYKRGLNALLVVELSADGKVTGVIVDGTSFTLAETARGIRPGASYEKIVAAYGYPNQTANEGQNLVLRYLYDGLTFRLSNMGLVAMRLSVNPLAPIPGGGGAPGAAPVPGITAPVAPVTGMPFPGIPTPGVPSVGVAAPPEEEISDH